METLFALIVAVLFVYALYYLYKGAEAKSRDRQGEICHRCVYNMTWQYECGTERECTHPDSPYNERLWGWPKRMVLDTQTNEEISLDDNWGMCNDSPRGRFVYLGFSCPHFESDKNKKAKPVQKQQTKSIIQNDAQPSKDINTPSLKDLKEKFDSVNDRIAQMEDTVTSSEFTWDRELLSGTRREENK